MRLGWGRRPTAQRGSSEAEELGEQSRTARGGRKEREGEGAPTGGARPPERGGAGLCGLGRMLRERRGVGEKGWAGPGVWATQWECWVAR